MEQWIRDQNVKHFRGVLLRDLSPEQRAVVEILLKNELAGSVDQSTPKAEWRKQT